MPRTLKIECTGDFFRAKTVPKIRLQGQWLEKLGFVPNGRVHVIPSAPGELRLVSETAPEFPLS